ncbi:hypothetical protein [Aquabacterium sp.]|uniref:hypothetical protein n=1 Tax=Aquabacterium sp. TaxID=1872578 RepID=UPI002CE56F2B|nr:hypothetical protein [Aquabacterium sp.]HSW05955.1 hypothetical protein [Aquabacterium sp.]
MHRATRLAFLFPWLPLGLALLPAIAAAALPAACDLHWQVTPQRGATPPQVAVALTFDAGNRSRTELQLPEGSELALLATEGTPALEAVPGRPLSRSVAHRPGERLTLRFALVPGPSAWLRLAPNSLVFAATALLPLPVDRSPERSTQQMCLGIDGLADGDALLANQGQLSSSNGDRLLRLQGPASLAREWVVAAGALQQAERRVEGQAQRVVMAAAAPMAFNAEALADAAAKQIGTVRRFWTDGEAPEQLLVLLPAPADTSPRGLALRQALLLQAPAPLTLPGAEIEALLMQTALQGWFRERFGPVAYEQRPDDPMNHWFSLGFAAFYSQRLRSATAQWSLQTHAAALSTLLQPATAAAGATPWLAMRWHGALREQGHAGLDAVLKRLMLPAAQARAAGPLSSPLATHRLQAALRPVLADAPRRDLRELVEHPGAIVPTPQTLGPCFRYDAALRQVLPATDGEPSTACTGWLNGSAAAVSATARSTTPAPKAKAAAKAKKKSKRGRH